MKNKRVEIDTLQIVVWGIIIFTQFIYYKNVEIATLYPDSSAYIGLNINGFLSGVRMPIYPLIINFCRILFPEKYLIAVVWLQIIISLGAVALLESTVYVATENRWISCILAVMWGDCPGVIGWNVIILTESLSLSFSIVMLYFTVVYLKTNKLKYGIGMSISGFLCTWHKMALFIYTFAILALLFFQYFCIESNRKMIRKLLLLNIVFIGVYILYAYCVWKHTGIFGLSTLGPRHMLAACLAAELYKNFPNPELVEKIELIFQNNNYSIGNDTTTPVMSLLAQYQISVKEFDTTCIKSDLSAYINYLLCNMLRYINVFYNGASTKYAYESKACKYLLDVQELLFTQMKIGYVYIISIVSFIITVWKWIKEKACPWFYLGTSGIILTIMISVYVGTYGDYPRCTVYVLPFAYFGTALLLNEVFKETRKNISLN